jgi:1,2-diacylglycerol 3-beta-galactosyltransferase
MLRVFWPQVWHRARHFLHRHPADAILSVHPLTNHYVVWALRRLGRSIPMLTLVTDPVSVHPFWLSPDVDRCLVGSVQARRKALSCGFSEEKVRITGLPVNPRFIEGLMDRLQARRALGWSLERPAVLLLGGGEGMGRLYETARSIDGLCPGIQLAVVAGRNRHLQERLEGTNWRIPMHIYGFVDHGTEAGGQASTMAGLMSAADVLVTKAGPGSLHEAFLAGLPLILNGAVPGQEEGNVHLVVENGAGVWAPDSSRVADLVERWTRADSDALERLAACSRALARPHAATAVADEIWRLALTKL